MTQAVLVGSVTARLSTTRVMSRFPTLLESSIAIESFVGDRCYQYRLVSAMSDEARDMGQRRNDPSTSWAIIEGFICRIALRSGSIGDSVEWAVVKRVIRLGPASWRIIERCRQPMMQSQISQITAENWELSMCRRLQTRLASLPKQIPAVMHRSVWPVPVKLPTANGRLSYTRSTWNNMFIQDRRSKVRPGGHDPLEACAVSFGHKRP